MNSQCFSDYLCSRAEQIDAALHRSMRERFAGVPQRLFESMQYSLAAGATRIRPTLLLESCRMAGGDETAALPFACALEMIHTYSLIHDDLPAMDNDDLRRGKPTNHRVYGEAMAILAGDALLNGAYELMADACRTRLEHVPAMVCIARAAGAGGMIGGQVLDMEADADVERMHQMKTGALLRCAVEAGLLCGTADAHLTARMTCFAKGYGVLFQITDDLLDVLGDTNELGKSVGKDQRDDKMTFVTKYGVARAQQLTRGYHQACLESLDGLPGTDFFTALLNHTIDRKR
ncbi:MAG: polyprenyl synthetase family protein [Eubacteriales bacterium]|nr:polyprenyl synthetase family protein [Eubacteriales bacterium]